MKLNEIIKIVEKEKENNKTIVTCNGCFDVLHIGHVYFLEEAKKQGDILIVGLNSDEYIKKTKGPGRPIFSEKERIKLIESLKPVDYAFIFYEDDPREFIKKIKPNVHVNGSEYGKNCIEAETMKKIGGRIHLVNRADIPISTTEIIERIRDS